MFNYFSNSVIHDVIIVVLPNGQAERLSVNHVDDDGNIALHYAAANELTACVERLVQLGSILSLVNKSQMTCCEMADEVSDIPPSRHIPRYTLSLIDF